jgi:hypothetical protein
VLARRDGIAAAYADLVVAAGDAQSNKEFSNESGRQRTACAVKYGRKIHCPTRCKGSLDSGAKPQVAN